MDLVETAIPDSEARPQSPTTNTDAILDALVALQPDGTAETIPSPLTPLLDTTLLTNARTRARTKRVEPLVTPGGATPFDVRRPGA